MKCVLGLKVPQLAQNGKDGLLPHFDEDHFMNQNRDLRRDGGHNTSCTFVRRGKVLSKRPHEAACAHLSMGYKQIFDKLVVRGRSIQDGLHVEFLNVFMLPKPPVKDTNKPMKNHSHLYPDSKFMDYL